MESDIAALKESIKDNDKDSIKANLLDQMLLRSKDVKYYIEESKKQSKDGEFTLEKYIVSEEEFKKNADKFFTEVENKRYTYKQLFTEIDGINKIKDKYYTELEPAYKEIDSLCRKFQEMIDDREKSSALMKDSLNKIIDLRLVSIEETEVGYRDVVAVKIQMINKTDKPVEALSFAAVLTDKLGNQLATLNCKTNDGFLKSDIGYWTYDRYSDMYDKLKNVSATHVTMKQFIKKVNLNGELLGSEIEDLKLGDYMRYYTDYDYKTPQGKLTGWCNYLDAENPYSEKIKVIEQRRSKEIEAGNFPIMKLYGEFDIYDFSKI